MLHSLKHIDGNHKSIEPYRIVRHGGIDGFYRLVVYLRALTNNRANTVFSYFQEGTAKCNVPPRVRSDLGWKIMKLADLCSKPEEYIGEV